MDKTVEWKAGDKAVITGNHNKHGFAIGDTVKLVSVYGSTIWRCKNDIRDTWLVREDDMRPLTEEEREGLEPSPTRETEADKDKNVPGKPRLAEVLGVEEDEKWRYPGCAGLYRIHNGVREYWDENNGWLYCDCEEDLVKIIAHPESIIRLPRLTEREISIMRGCGAKWVSWDGPPCESNRVELWKEKPEQNGGGTYFGPGFLARVIPEIFPSVKPGDCIGLEDAE